MIPEKSKITLEVLNYKDRPVSATAGEVEIRNVRSVEVECDFSKPLKLLFDNEQNLEERVFNEQFIL